MFVKSVQNQTLSSETCLGNCYEISQFLPIIFQQNLSCKFPQISRKTDFSCKLDSEKPVNFCFFCDLSEALVNRDWSCSYLGIRLGLPWNWHYEYHFNDTFLWAWIANYMYYCTCSSSPIPKMWMCRIICQLQIWISETNSNEMFGEEKKKQNAPVYLLLQLINFFF